MKLKRTRQAVGVALLAQAFAAVGGCGKFTGDDEGSGEDAGDTGVKTETTGGTSTVTSSGSQAGTGTAADSPLDPRCDDASTDATIASYDDFVLHFKALTEAVGTVGAACLIASLPRPLKVNATSSDLSVQPASGRDNPRVFVVVGTEDVVVLGFGLAGRSAETIELSVLAPGDTTTSVKGEITLPVTKPVAFAAPFAQAAGAVGDGSTCGACHGAESAAPSRFGEIALTSLPLRPMAHQNVSIDALDTARKACATGNSSSTRCGVLEALFMGGTPDAYDFPAAMKTIF